MWLNGGIDVRRYFKNKWFLLFLLIPFFKPVCLQYYSKLALIENVFVIWKIVSAFVAIVAFILYIWKRKYTKIPKLIIWIGLFEGSILFSTIFNRGNLMKGAIDAVSIISFAIILTLGIKYNHIRLIQILGKLMKVLVLLNLLSIICFPNGLNGDLYHNKENALYFMVVDNGSALFLSFSCLVFLLDSFIRKGYLSKKHKVYIGICFLSAVLSKSATAILLLIVLLIGIMLLMKGSIDKIINPKILFSIYLCLFVFLITMQNNIVIAFILNYVFGRSSNFTGRYVLWEQAIRLIIRKPILGYGRIVNDYISAWGGYYSSHNYALEILLQGGIVALGFFVKIIIDALKKLDSRKIAKYILLVLWGMLIAAMMESAVHSVYIFGTICFCYYSKYFTEKEENYNGEKSALECNRSHL